MSLSTTKRRFVSELHDLADLAYFRRSIIVASAHNMPVRSYPWRFSSVMSVASHDQDDPLAWYRNPQPPVEFYARGVDVDVAWMDGARLRSTGNSFATPHISGICALILAKHPDLTPSEVKTLLGTDGEQRTGRGMSERSDLQAAIAAGALAGDETHRALLSSIVQVARAIFHARAASVLLLDDAHRRAGVRSGHRRGRGHPGRARDFRPAPGSPAGCWSPANRWCSTTWPQDTRFSDRFASDTGYVPKGIMAVPLLYGERCLGVLEVLDRPEQSRFSLEESELLGLFGHQAAIALELMTRARAASSALECGDPADAAGGEHRRVGDRRPTTTTTELATRFLSSLDALLQTGARDRR